MLDYVLLKIIWWVLIGGVLIIYACTAGFDAGVTLYMPFLRNELDQRIILNTSAPTWDGNLTWLVFAGGSLFVIWPVVYTTAFSSLYAVILLIIFSLFLRPPGYDYRNKINNHYWRIMWDFALFISAIVPVFVFGVVLGNCFIGFPFYFEPHTFRSFYLGHSWQLFNFYGLLCGIISVLMTLMHGSVYLQRRTENHLRKLAFKIHVVCALFLLITFTTSGLLLTFVITGYKLISSAHHPTQLPLHNIVMTGVGYWIQTYNQYPWKYAAPIIVYGGIIGSLWAAKYNRYNTTFWSSCFAVGGIITTAGATLFPFLMPSSINVNQSLTIWNSPSSQYTLNIMLYITIPLLIIILGYKIFAYHTVWNKKSTLVSTDIEKNSHTFY